MACGTLLEERIQWHREEAAEETNDGEGDGCDCERCRAARQHDRGCPHPERADRRQSELDFVAGQAPRRDAAGPDADGRERGEDANPSVVETQNLGAEQQQHGGKESSEEPEVGQADHRQR